MIFGPEGQPSQAQEGWVQVGPHRPRLRNRPLSPMMRSVHDEGYPYAPLVEPGLAVTVGRVGGGYPRQTGAFVVAGQAPVVGGEDQAGGVGQIFFCQSSPETSQTVVYGSQHSGVDGVVLGGLVDGVVVVEEDVGDVQL